MILFGLVRSAITVMHVEAELVPWSQTEVCMKKKKVMSCSEHWLDVVDFTRHAYVCTLLSRQHMQEFSSALGGGNIVRRKIGPSVSI